jgi:apolipoprotein N-acyltransferase
LNFALSAASAVLLILIFPRFNFTWLAPVALTPILLACARELSWKRRFLQGWFAGVIFWAGVCYWIQFVLEVHGGMGRWGGWGAFALFALYKGLQLAVFATLAGRIMRQSWALPAVAALWTGVERTHGPTGFPWLDLGNAAIDMPLPLRVVPIVGVYGASFLFAMLGCAVALVILRRPRRDLAWLLAFAVLYVLPSAPAPVRGTETALVVQPNVDTEQDWSPTSLDALEKRMALLSMAPGANLPHINLIVWPETPAPLYFPGDAQLREMTSQIARTAQAPVMFGAVGRTAAGGPLNSAVMMNAAGEFAGRYDKIKLVPFGEFVPPLFRWVNRITQEAGDYAAGSKIVVFPMGEHHLGAYICYESAFPDLVRQFPRDGASLLINISNDGYFGPRSGREQHLALVRMRAAENRRWIVRASNDGITAAIDPAGRVFERLAPYQQLAARLRYGYVAEQTVYTRIGDWFAWLCLLAGLVLAGVAALSPARP